MQLQDENKSSDGESEDQQSENDKQRSPDEHEGEKGQKGPADSCYEFSLTESTILEVVMDSMRTCGLALALQALSTLLLGMLQLAVGFLFWLRFLGTAWIAAVLSAIDLPVCLGILCCSEKSNANVQYADQSSSNLIICSKLHAGM